VNWLPLTPINPSVFTNRRFDREIGVAARHDHREGPHAGTGARQPS